MSDKSVFQRKIIGLTGKMASGKNLAAKILENLGCVSIDADLVVHDAVESAKDKIIQTFEKEANEKNINFIDENGKIIRKELSKIVFSSEENLKKQESIVHPEVEKIMEDFINKNPDKNIILNATVLYKVPLISECDTIIFITAPSIVRFIRAKKRDKLSTKQILKRFYAQNDLFAKYQKLNSDIYKVRNLGSKKLLEKKLTNLFKQITTESPS